MSFRSTTSAALLELFKRLTSRRLWMVIFACTLPWLGLERGVNHLYALQQWQAGVYGGMFLAVMGGIVAIVGKYMGIDSQISATSSVQGVIQAAASAVTEKIERHDIIETIEHVVDEGAPGAPARRPFNPDLEDDGN